MNLSPLILANALANSILAVSAIHLWLKVFGHEESAIYQHPYAALLCKLATAITICGSVANIFNHQEPPITEFVLNIGVAMNYTWLSWFSTMSVDKPKKKNGTQHKPITRTRSKSSGTRA
jgi:hypothetical protein